MHTNEFDLYLRLYLSALRFYEANPFDHTWAWECELWYDRMLKAIPQSHYDEINFIVYGITRS